MTYGHFLDQACGQLGSARDTVPRQGVAGHTDAAATVTARARLYHRLAQLTELLGGHNQIGSAGTAAADRLVNSPASVAAAGPGGVLATGLRLAVADADLRPAGSTQAPPARHLHEAAAALAAAGDILASHVGGSRGPARTPEGRAIWQGAGRAGALADIAAVTGIAIDTDRRLHRWFAGGSPADQTLREATVARMRWWTEGNFPTVLRSIAGYTAGTSVLRLLDTAPATELSTGPRPVSGPADVVAVLATGRAWLMQNPRSVGLAHAIAGTRLAITIAAAQHRLTGGDQPGGPGRSLAQWRSVAKVLPEFADLVATRTGDGAAVADQLVAANDWLRVRVRAYLAGAEPDPRLVTALPELTSQLPGLAETLHTGLRNLAGPPAGSPRLFVRGAAIDLDSVPRGGVYHARATWEPTDIAGDDVRSLLGRLRGAATTSPDTALHRALTGKARHPASPDAAPAPPQPARNSSAAQPTAPAPPAVAATPPDNIDPNTPRPQPATYTFRLAPAPAATAPNAAQTPNPQPGTASRQSAGELTQPAAQPDPPDPRLAVEDTAAVHTDQAQPKQDHDRAAWPTDVPTLDQLTAAVQRANEAVKVMTESEHVAAKQQAAEENQRQIDAGNQNEQAVDVSREGPSLA